MVKNTIGKIVVFMITATLIYLMLGFVGVLDLQFYKHYGKEKANIQHEIFKENTSYIEGMASDLAKYKYEISIEKDVIARKAIANLIIDKYSNFDINKLEDSSLQNFLRDIRNGKYNQ
jgi:hypothetical protein